MKTVFLNRFFHPDHSATSQMLSQLAFDLAERGREIAVITSRQRYDAPSAELPAEEVIRGVTVHRVKTSRFGRLNLVGRAWDYLTFYGSAAWRLWLLVRPGDVVVAKTDPPMLSVVAGPLCRLRGARLVNWLQDIFPETAEALGVGGALARAPFRLLRSIRNISVRRAHVNVALGGRMIEHLTRIGVNAGRIHTIPNWADGAEIFPVEPLENPLRAEWDLEESFVVAYSGNLGRAHEVDTLVEAISVLERRERRAAGLRIEWVFIGGGARLEQLRAEVGRCGLKSVRFKPYQDSALLAYSLSVADVHLISLRPELEGLIVPSKFYGIAAAGRASIFVGDPEGEIASLLERHACGRIVWAGDGIGLARAVLAMAIDRDETRRMGERARGAFESEWDRRLAVARWERLLFDVGGQLAPQPAPARAAVD